MIDKILEKRDRRRRALLLAVLGLVLATAIGIRLAMVKVSVEHIPVTTDEAIVVLLAKRVAEGERPLFIMAQPYQFPLESYLHSLLVDRMPRNASGARYPGFLGGGATLLLLLCIAWRLTPFERAWPMLGLILLPSAYLLMAQFGYPLPGYNAALVCAFLAVFLAMSVPEKEQVKSLVNPLALVFLTGLFGGLAFTGNMLTVSLVLPALFVALVRSGFLRMFVHLPALALGTFIGLIPYIAGILAHPDAQKAVAGTRSLPEALERIWSPTLTFTIPRGLGVAPAIYPDSHVQLELGQSLAPYVGIFFGVVLVAVTVIRTWHFLRQALQGKWPVLSGYDIFTAASWAGIAAFALSSRANSDSFRYLMPVLFCFPFLLGCLFVHSGRMLRLVLGGAAAFLMIVNVSTSLALIPHWKEPSFGPEIMNVSVMEPALDYLRTQNIEYCVASHWAAYRASFLTDEDIICSQPVNERFPGWPLPYKEQVDGAKRVAYVLTERIRFLKPHIFERHLEQMNIAAHRETLGEFKVYHDFRELVERAADVPLPKQMQQASALHSNQTAHRLVDGDPATRWGNRRSQKAGEWVQVAWETPRLIQRVVLDYTCYRYDRPFQVNIEARTEQGWQTAAQGVQDRLEPFVFANSHPVYGHHLQTYAFDPVIAQAVRVTIAEPNASRNWNICEVDVFSLLQSQNQTHYMGIHGEQQ